MGRSDFHDALLHRPEDARDEGDPDTMAELDVIETESRHFPQHRVPILMPVRTPTGG
jgi:hypothetical protein